MSTHIKGVFRNFEFPQFFATLPQINSSWQYLNRRIREFSKESIKEISRPTERDYDRVRVKIQKRTYISSEGDAQHVIENIKKNKSLHPCRLITLIRFLTLKNIDELPDEIKANRFILAWAGGNNWYKISIPDKTIHEYKIDYVDVYVMIIIESDPI